MAARDGICFARASDFCTFPLFAAASTLRPQGSMYIRFVENPGTCQDPTPDAPPVDDLNNPKNIPGKEARRCPCCTAYRFPFSCRPPPRRCHGGLYHHGPAGSPTESSANCRGQRPCLPLEPSQLFPPGGASQVRKQTCDLVSMLELAAPLADFYYFMEDDFHVCGHMARPAAPRSCSALRIDCLSRVDFACLRMPINYERTALTSCRSPQSPRPMWQMRALHYLLQKVQVAQPDWLALRMSYGMNGTGAPQLC